MKKLLLAACAFVAMPAVAQTTPLAPAPPVQRPAMNDRVEARAEVTARTQRMFAMLDVNHDGVLDQTELAAAGKRWDGPRDAAGGVAAGRLPLDRNAMFDRIDTNRDGSISRDEFARAPMPGHDSDGDGQADRPHGGMGGGMARMWTMADANHDGRVTLQEASDIALRHFDMMDANHDGQLTPDERAAARAQMRGQR